MGSISRPLYSLFSSAARNFLFACGTHSLRLRLSNGSKQKEQQQQPHAPEEALIPITLCGSFVNSPSHPVVLARLTVESTSGCRRAIRPYSCDLRRTNRTVFSPIRNAIANGCVLSSHCHRKKVFKLNLHKFKSKIELAVLYN